MRLTVLGAAAGGGFPQWNCGCPNCTEVRGGLDGAASAPRLKPRTQDSAAVSADGRAWFLLNASPDVHRQIEATPALQPRGPRRSPIAGVVLTNGDLDHVLGLLSLRESTPLHLFATERVRRGLVEGNAFFRTLQRFDGQVTWHALALDRETELAGPDGPSGLFVTAVPMPGKLPVHLEALPSSAGAAPGGYEPSPEDSVGLWIRDPRAGTTAVYASAAGSVGPYANRLAGADACLFDGTFWSSDELVRLGLSTKRAEDMAHLPVGGPAGSLALLAKRRAKRMILTHLNNTNPLLLEGSPERGAVEEAGWEIAEDGLEVFP